MSDAILHHGTDDVLVPFSHAGVIEKALKTDNTKVELQSNKDATHGFTGPSKADDDARSRSVKLTKEFFEKHL